MYLNIALIILYSFLENKFEKNPDYFIISGIIFLILVIMMLSARMAIITNVLTCLFFIILMKSFTFKKRLLHILLFVITSTVGFFITNKFYNRIDQVQNAVQHLDENKPETHSEYNSATSRPELWKEAIEVIQKHPLLGAGTGDIKDELFGEYETHNFQYALIRKLNPHNQFLHTTVGQGLIGLILLLLCFGSQFYFSFINKDWIYFFFLTIIFLNALTESNIEVQSGILLFNFLSMFFYCSLKNRVAQ